MHVAPSGAYAVCAEVLEDNSSYQQFEESIFSCLARARRLRSQLCMDWLALNVALMPYGRSPEA